MKMMKSTEYLQERLKIFDYINSITFHFANTKCNYDTTSLQLLYISFPREKELIIYFVSIYPLKCNGRKTN